MIYYRQSKRGANGRQRQRLPKGLKKRLDKQAEKCYTKDKLRGNRKFKRGADAANLEKVLDKRNTVWYNQGIKGKAKIKSERKIFRKPLDK